jgi:hypothetical protein
MAGGGQNIRLTDHTRIISSLATSVSFSLEFAYVVGIGLQ